MIPRDTEIMIALVLGMVAVLISGASRTESLRPVTPSTLDQISTNRAVVEAVKSDLRRAREILVKLAPKGTTKDGHRDN